MQNGCIQSDQKSEILVHKGNDSTNYLGYYAGFVSRLIALMIDSLIILLIIVAAIWFFSITVTVFQLSATWEYLKSIIPQLSVWFGWVVVPLTGTLSVVIFICLYHITFTTVLGQTPGKILMGVRVLTVDGSRVTFWRATLRMFGYVIAMIPFFLGFFWVLIDDRRQGWHDKIAGTFVLYAWSAQPDEKFLVESINQLRRISFRTKNRTE